MFFLKLRHVQVLFKKNVVIFPVDCKPQEVHKNNTAMSSTKQRSILSSWPIFNLFVL